MVENLGNLNVADLTQPAGKGKNVSLQGDPSVVPAPNFRPNISPEAAERNAALSQGAESGLRLQQHVEGIVGLFGVERLNRDAELARLGREFRAAQARSREALLKIQADIEQRGLPQSVVERHAQTLARHDAHMAAFDRALDGAATGSPGAATQLNALLNGATFVRRPTMPTEPTVQAHVVEAPRLSRAEADARLVPASPSGINRRRAMLQTIPARGASANRGGPAPNADPPVAADLAPTPDVQITQEIIDRAAALGNSPLAIYEFVRNKASFQPYLGSRKGSAFALQQLAGNDTDQASLLIALFRAAGIPARYARGTIEMTPEQAMAMTGVEEAHTAASILTTAGLDGVAIVDGPDIVAVRCTRVWVLAYVPYSNYRGAPNEDTGKGWIPLDPGFKAWSVNPGQDVLAAMGWNVDDFLADYISTFHPLSPIEQLQADIRAWLDANQPGATVPDIERQLSIAGQNLGLLPVSLPYQLVSVSGDFAELEDTKRYKVRFHLHDGGTTFIDHTIRLSDLAGHRLTIQYVGATPADQAVIDSFGTIYETPPNLVDVKPVLKVDDTPIATASTGIGMGVSHSSDMYFLQPVGDDNPQPLVQNVIIAGNGQAIAFDTFLDEGGDLFGFGGFGSGAAVEGLLHPTAAEYLNRVDAGQEVAARLLQMVSLQDVSEAIVESSISVSFSFGVPVTFEWTGLIVDADRRIIGPFAADGDSLSKVPYMKLTGYDGSILENRVFEDTYGQDAVSTIKILQLSNDAGIGVCTITTSIAGDCPGFTHSASIISAVNSALAEGHEVTIPRSPITVGEWSGTGYIDLTPSTGAAGYIIAGGISGRFNASGGATVEEWSINLTCSPTGPLSGSITPNGFADGGHLYADSKKIGFTVDLMYDCEGAPGQSLTVARETRKTRRQIFTDFGGGTYTISVPGTMVTPVTFVLFDFEGKFTPDDNFTGRSQDRYGLEETVDLNFETIPAGLTAVQVGGLEWTIHSGVGSLSNAGADGTADFDADATAGALVFRLSIKSGPASGEFKSYDRTVAAPSGTRMTRTSTRVWHVMNTASAGIQLYYWLDPVDVSFNNLTFGEGVAAIENGSGVLASIGSHPQNYFGAIRGGNSSTGCRVQAADHAWVRASPPFGDGSFTWNIPTQYLDDTGSRQTFGTLQNHVSEVWANGDATQTKAGLSGSAAASDPTSGW